MAPNDKLKDDPIVEAVLELRFVTPDLQEVLIGKLSDMPLLRVAVKNRLPTADIPAIVRQANAAFFYMPTIEAKNVLGIATVRIGANVLSLHFVHPYAGWPEVYPRISAVIDEAFGAVPTLAVNRIGLKYVNVFTKARHHIDSVYDLAVSVEVAKVRLSDPITLVFTTEAPDYVCQTRVASKRFLMGSVPADTAAAADIDIATVEGYASTSADDVKKWIDYAHSAEKRAFRRLLPDNLYAKLLGAH